MESSRKRPRVDDDPDYMSLMETLQQLAEKSLISEQQYLDFSTILKEHRDSKESKHEGPDMVIEVSVAGLSTRQIRLLQRAATNAVVERV